MDWKATLTSRTIWGAVITLIALIAGPQLTKFGITVDVAGWTEKAVEAAGLLLTIYGRMHAQGPLVTPASQI